MKKIIFSLLMTGLVGLALSASAQTPPEENNTNAPALADLPTPPPGGDNGPDAGGLPPPPPELFGVDTATNNSAPEENQAREPLVITPSQAKAAPHEEIQSDFMPPSEAGTNANDLNLKANMGISDIIKPHMAMMMKYSTNWLKM